MNNDRQKDASGTEVLFLQVFLNIATSFRIQSLH